MRGDISNFLVQLLFFGLLGAFVLFMIAGVTTLAVPIAIAFLIGLVLNPLVDFLEGLGIPRFFAVFFVFIGMIVLLVIVVNLIAPMILGELQSLSDRQDILRDRAIGAINGLREDFGGSLPGLSGKGDAAKLVDRAESMITGMMPQDMSFLGNFVTYLIVTPIITVVFLWQGHEIFRRLMYMIPNRYFEMVILLVNSIYSNIIAYMKGLVIQWIILSTVFCTGFFLIGLPYWPVIGLLAATVNIIPYLGPIIGAVPAIVVAIMEPGASLLVPTLIVIGIGQAVDNVFIQPVILARSVELHPLIAILAVITMQQYLGIIGMVIAIPLASIVMVSIEIIYRQLKAFGVI